jgi:predicted glycosyltransferase involved in capsule biosynthesis
MVSIGVVIGVRNRSTIYEVVEAFMEAGAKVAVIEQNNSKSFAAPEGCLHTFIKTSDVYSRSLSNNIGIDMLKDEVDYIWLADADIKVERHVIENLKKLLDGSIFFPKIDNYTTGVHTGNMVVPSRVFEKVMFNEDIVGWGYEDDDFLHRCKAIGYLMKYAVDVGSIIHVESDTPEKPEHLFPGCKKWNNWGYNVIVSDYSLKIDDDDPGFGAGDIRREFPKKWMDKKDIIL